MASMTVRSTYSLDTETANSIRELAKRWSVSQAEVIRRSVRIAVAEQQTNAPSPAEVVAHYQARGAPRNWDETRRIAAQFRAEREAEDLRRTSWHR
jgi:hypothetical protein